MPRNEKDNQEIRDARREHFLEAATRMFAQRGFATRISEIAREAGLSHGLVYHYFESKEAIYDAIADRLLCKIQEDLEPPETDPWERIRLSVARGIERLSADPSGVIFFTRAMLGDSVPERLKEKLKVHASNHFARATGLMRDAQAAGYIAGDKSPEELASALMCMMRGLAISRATMLSAPWPTPSTETILGLIGSGARTTNKSAPATRKPTLVSKPRTRAAANAVKAKRATKTASRSKK